MLAEFSLPTLTYGIEILLSGYYERWSLAGIETPQCLELVYRFLFERRLWLATYIVLQFEDPAFVQIFQSIKDETNEVKLQTFCHEKAFTSPIEGRTNVVTHGVGPRAWTLAVAIAGSRFRVQDTGSTRPTTKT